MLFRLFYAIRRYSQTRMSRRFLIQGISYNRMRTRTFTSVADIHILGAMLGFLYIRRSGTNSDSIDVPSVIISYGRTRYLPELSLTSARCDGQPQRIKLAFRSREASLTMGRSELVERCVFGCSPTWKEHTERDVAP